MHPAKFRIRIAPAHRDKKLGFNSISFTPEGILFALRRRTAQENRSIGIGAVRQAAARIKRSERCSPRTIW